MAPALPEAGAHAKMRTSSPLIQEALCSGDARCVVEAVEKACRLKGLPVPHELYGEMTLESLIAVMAAIGLDLRTERLN